jgi:hypothetical protein
VHNSGGIKSSGESCPESNNQVKWLASETGGEILDANNKESFLAALEKAISTLRQQYTLGFAPPDAGDEGAFHKLTVSIAAEDRCPGCQVLARNGYYTGLSARELPPKVISAAGHQARWLTDQEVIQVIMLNAGMDRIDLTDVPFTVVSKKVDSQGQPQLRLDIGIDFAGLSFTEEKGIHACNLHVGVLYTDREGNILGTDWKKVQGQLNEQSYDRIMKEGIRVSTTIPIKTDNQLVKVIVYDDKSEKLGSKTINLDGAEKLN